VTVVAAVALAGLGAACFAGAGVLQHRAVGTAPGARLDHRALGALVRRPRWLAGLALAGAGATLHAVALVLAPLSVVQPVGVLAVPFAVLLGARRCGVRPGRGVAGAVAASVTGVGAFVTLAAGSAVSGRVDGGTLLIAGAVVAALVLGLAAVAARIRGLARCIACATAGATAFGLVSTLVRSLAEQVFTGAAVLDVAGVVAGIAAALLAGGWLVQQAFAAGPPELVVAGLTVVDPLVAVGLGVVLLGEGAATGLPTALAMGGGAAVAVAGVFALALHHPDATARRTAARSRPTGRSDEPEPARLS
jgi:hypothetical protein